MRESWGGKDFLAGEYSRKKKKEEEREKSFSQIVCLNRDG